MAIEQSCLKDEQSVKNFVESTYGFRPETVKKLDTGSANCFQIWANGNGFFLKEFQEKFNRAALEREVRVCALVSEVIPTSRFIPSLNGDVIYEFGGRLFHLQQLLEGRIYPQNQFDQPLLVQEAETLAKIHRCLDRKIALPEGFPAPWFEIWNTERTIKKYEKICEEKLADTGNPLSQQLADACQVKLSLLQSFNLDYGRLKGLAAVNSHGDYNNLQILVDERHRICAVIDFSSAACLPAVWEIIRSYTLSAKTCAGGVSINLNELKYYLDAYLAIRSLPLFDVVHMADFYYFDLLRSSFGFNAEDEVTARFALWRTNMCVLLEQNAERIRKYFYNASRNVLK